MSKRNPRINRDAQNMHEDAEQAEAEVRSGMMGAGFFTACVVLMDRDRRLLNEMARDIRRTLIRRDERMPPSPARAGLHAEISRKRP